MYDERPDSDIRKRAAWLLAMLAVVAGLFVVLSLTLFDTSGGGGTDHGADIADPPTTVTTPAGTTTGGTTTAGTATAGTTPARSGTASRPAPASPSTSPSTSASSGPVPTPSCPGRATCAVRGDVAGAMTAINAYRAKKGKKPVPTTSGATADACALSSGSDCPSSFVWVRVDDLSGAGVVKGVSRFNSDNELLDNNATSFEVGWAYDPGSKSVSCALIRHD